MERVIRLMSQRLFPRGNHAKPVIAVLGSILLILLASVNYCYAAANSSSKHTEDKITVFKTKPIRPYRAWFLPPEIVKRPGLYKDVNLLLGQSGRHPKKMAILDSRGIAVLKWHFGPQSPWANINNDPIKYFRQQCDPSSKGYKYAGVAIDEWVTGFKSVSVQGPLAAIGYREGRVAWPDAFIACWVTTPDKVFIKLMQDKVFDLAIIEGYTCIPHKDQPWGGLSWSTVIARCEMLKKAGVLNRTIVCLGYLIAPKNGHPGITKKELRNMMLELKHKYPQMPGVAFYGAGNFMRKEVHENDSQTISLIKYANKLAKKLYPSKVVLSQNFDSCTTGDYSSRSIDSANTNKGQWSNTRDAAGTMFISKEYAHSGLHSLKIIRNKAGDNAVGHWNIGFDVKTAPQSAVVLTYWVRRTYHSGFTVRLNNKVSNSPYDMDLGVHVDSEGRIYLFSRSTLDWVLANTSLTIPVNKWVKIRQIITYKNPMTSVNGTYNLFIMPKSGARVQVADNRPFASAPTTLTDFILSPSPNSTVYLDDVCLKPISDDRR